MKTKSKTKKETLQKVILAYSGGLDTSYCIAYFQDQGFEVITVTVDTGAISTEEKKAIAKRAKELGVKKHMLIEVKDTFYKKIISYIIKGNVLRGGLYPLCVGPERIVIAEEVVKIAHKEGSTMIAHGSTGAGNDQIRFELGIRSLDPKIKILAPIRDLQLTREQETAFLMKRGVHISAVAKAYSINTGMLGTTIGGKETKGTWECPPDSVYPNSVPLEKTPNKADMIVLSYKAGLPVAINDKKMNGPEILSTLEKLGNKHGIGKKIHLGNTILGIKGRVAFSAAAMMILINSHKELEKLILTKAQAFWKDMLADVYGGFMHEALYYDPVMRDIEAMIDSCQKNVTGDVRIKLFKGNVIIEGARSPYSMMNPDVAVYGEENTLWSGAEAAGFAKIYGIQSILANAVEKKNKK